MFGNKAEKIIQYEFNDNYIVCNVIDITDDIKAVPTTFYKMKSVFSIFSKMRKAVIFEVSSHKYYSLYSQLKYNDTSDFSDLETLHNSMKNSKLLDRFWEAMNKLGNDLGKWDLLIIAGIIILCIGFGMFFGQETIK